MTAERALRITVTAGVFPALSETFVIDQVSALLAMGHDVRVIADRPRDGAETAPGIAALLARTRHLHVSSRRLEKLVPVLRALRLGGPRFAAAAIALARARRKTRETGRLAELASLVVALAEAPRPDVVVCHFGLNGSIMARALDALGWDVPLATAFHGFDVTQLVQASGPRLYDNLFRKGELFLPACDAFVERLRGLGCPPDRIAVQRMCVDPRRVGELAGPPDAARGGPFTFVCAGRLVRKKGGPQTLRAFARAFASAPAGTVRLRIIGDGPLRGELEDVVREAGIADRVELAGALPRDRVLRAMREADAVVQASVTAPDGDMEASPVVISEAMALGRPVVATRHSGIPELAADGETALLVDEGDEAALAEAMAWLRSRPDDARRMGEAGRLRVERLFAAADWNALLDRRLRAAAAREAPPCRE